MTPEQQIAAVEAVIDAERRAHQIREMNELTFLRAVSKWMRETDPTLAETPKAES